MRRAFAVMLTVVACSSGTARAGDIGLDELQLRIAPAGATTAAVYFTAHNRGANDDTLRSITSSAGVISLHHTMARAGAMQMMPLTDAVIPAGGELRFAVGARHGMLEQFTRPLAVGDTVSLEFRFARHGAVRLVTTILPVGGVE